MVEDIKVLIKCELCANSTTGSEGFHIDINNGEIICRSCGCVSQSYVYKSYVYNVNDVYEK